MPFVGEWLKQLFGESEGKDGKGIFPASAQFTTDLHSLGQYIQDGERHLFETVIYVDDTGCDIAIPHSDDNGDNLNYLAGRPLSFVRTADCPRIPPFPPGRGSGFCPTGPS